MGVTKETLRDHPAKEREAAGTTRPVFRLPVTDGLVATLVGAGAVKKRYGRGAIVHQSGDACDRVEVILEGRVGVERIGETGDLMVLADFGPGDLLGAHLLFGAQPIYPMTIVTRTPATLLGIGREGLLDLLSGDRGLLASYLAAISTNSGVLSARIRDQHRRSIREILLTWLRDRVQATDDRRVPLGMSKKAMAEQMGVRRTSLSRELQKMRADGLIEVDRDAITLCGLLP